MNPQVIDAIIALVEEAIKDTPALLAQFQEIFSKPNPTPDDWKTMRADILAKTYKDFVPDSALPDGPPAPKTAS